MEWHGQDKKCLQSQKPKERMVNIIDKKDKAYIYQGGKK